MLHVLLFILKIIGILLLAVVLLLLSLVLIVLFVPVRYQIKASVLEKRPDVSLRITWLLHLLSVRAAYHPGESPGLLEIKLLGIQLGKQKNKEKKKEKPKDVLAHPEPEPYQKPLKEPCESAQKGDEAVRETETAENDIQEALEKDWQQAQEEREAAFDTGQWEAEGEGAETEEKGSLLSRLKTFLEKLAAFLQDADNQSLFRLLWKETGGIFRHVRPRKLRLYLHFGFDDPYLTGKVLGYVSMFYAYYHRNVELAPEFEKQVLEGNLYAKGRVQAARFVYTGIRLLLHKGCRSMMKKVLSK